MNKIEAFRKENGLTYEELGARAGYRRDTAWKHCQSSTLSGEAAIRYHQAWGIPLEQLRPDLYENRGASQEPPPEVTA